MKKQIVIFDDDKSIRLSYLPDYEKPFELTDTDMRHVYLSENQLKELAEMIPELLQHLNKRDW